MKRSRRPFNSSVVLISSLGFIYFVLTFIRFFYLMFCALFCPGFSFIHAWEIILAFVIEICMGNSNNQIFDLDVNIRMNIP